MSSIALQTSNVALSKRVGQLTLDDLGEPLDQVTFCVIDIETTGGSPKDCAITEVAAAKFRGGRCIGELATLINPGVQIPPMITVLTGITTAMLLPAPTIDHVLGSLREFVGNSVIVGHNVRFDLSFLNEAFRREGWPPFENRVVDTCRLARRLIRDEVQNCKLGTLAQHFRLPNQPTHRALADVRATADLLHLLVERAAGFGVLGLDDLLELPAINRHPQAHKLALTNTLPRRAGVYIFRDVSGKVIYVGKASNLRARVRSYFSSDDRRKVEPLLQVLHRIDHVVCTTELEAAVLENRLIQRELPRFNRQAKFWTAYRYIRIVGKGAASKIAVTATSGGLPGASYIGPFRSMASARMATMALREAATFFGPTWTEALENRPEQLLETLAVNMRTLAEDERFEEATLLRDRAGTLARGIDRQRKAQALRHTGWLTLTVGLPGTKGTHELRFADGRLRFGDGRPDGLGQVAASEPVPMVLVDELAIVTSWLDRIGPKARINHADRGLAFPSAPMVRFSAVPQRPSPANPAHDRLVAPLTPRSMSRSLRSGQQDANASNVSGATVATRCDDHAVGWASSSWDTRTKESSDRAAKPPSTAAAANSRPSRKSSASPATTQAADAFSNTMSRWAPGSPSSTRRRKTAFSAAVPPRS